MFFQNKCQLYVLLQVRKLDNTLSYNLHNITADANAGNISFSAGKVLSYGNLYHPALKDCPSCTNLQPDQYIYIVSGKM